MDVSSLVEVNRNKQIPDIAAGDTVKVYCRIVEGDRERIQVFQGVVIKISKGGAGASFTVRHVASGIGVERTFPFLSTNVEKVEIVRQGKVRRSRLYYLRSLSGKEARRKIKRVERKSREVPEELIAEPEEELKPEDVVTEEPVVEEAPETVEATQVEEAPVEAEAPVAEAPAAEEPVAVAEESAVAEPVAAEEPVAEEPAVAEPVAAEEPVAEASAAAEEPVAQEETEPVAEAAESPDAEEASEKKEEA
jgi:large subunit ribosomal protein L19